MSVTNLIPRDCETLGFQGIFRGKRQDDVLAGVKEHRALCLVFWGLKNLTWRKSAPRGLERVNFESTLSRLFDLENIAVCSVQVHVKR
jgi:hypothetical protein